MFNSLAYWLRSRFPLMEGLAEMRFLAKGYRYRDCQTIPLEIKRQLVRSDLPRLAGRYYFTTDRGIFALEGTHLYQLTTTGGFGLALSGDMAYGSLDFGALTCVVSFPASALLGGGKVEATVRYRRVGRHSRERIHQLTCVNNGPVWFANTGRNTLVRLDTQGNGYSEFAPLSDAFSTPVFSDHNHINSVVDYGDYVLFAAFKAGSGSLIGLIDGDTVTGFSYPVPGVHDIYTTATGFVFCDSFGAGSSGGGVIGEQGRYPLTLPHGGDCLVRGIAGEGAGESGEWLVGCSYKQDARNRRFDGNGTMLVLRGGKQVTSFTTPAAQIFQIINASGGFFQPSPAMPKDTLLSLLRRTLGAPSYTGRLVPVPPAAA
jgi:hypothetical protein